MSDGELSTREALLLAAIDCIEAHGLDRVTTRMIAECAGANIASINYHFRSKQRLIEEALTTTVTHMLEDVRLTIDDASLPFRETLRDVLYYLIAGGLTWPGITRAHLYRVAVENDYASVSAEAILEAFDWLHARAVAALPDEDPARLRLLLSDLLAAVMLKMLAPGFFALDERYRPEDEARCRRLAAHYTHVFYAALAAPS